ncbi:uncharacterized protein LAESUDRAFT_811676 [Laetiporus sulphureus 93-53]|uniref:Uncharacterized protein n=1 Tax=Laetiporus sulphureus 93-53 TaxID=1314785 RepID=A0A165F260_9APHY|nr:uncharacterized protein LAESUDRAFT_811676 [Laetiporus sulphureus 93-53]KZT08216.1 hypothetical protein LAESUDRAFT_811676 [Laetiporus sulphureus 93-53]
MFVTRPSTCKRSLAENDHENAHANEKCPRVLTGTETAALKSIKNENKRSGVKSKASAATATKQRRIGKDSTKKKGPQAPPKHQAKSAAETHSQLMRHNDLDSEPEASIDSPFDVPGYVLKKTDFGVVWMFPIIPGRPAPVVQGDEHPAPGPSTTVVSSQRNETNIIVARNVAPSEVRASEPVPVQPAAEESASKPKPTKCVLTHQEFAMLLERCAASDFSAIEELKELAKGTKGLQRISDFTELLADRARVAWNAKSKEDSDMSMVPTFVFLQWFNSYHHFGEFAGALLETTHPNSKKRVMGLDRIAFNIAFALVAHFALDVSLYTKGKPSHTTDVPKMHEPEMKNLNDELMVWNWTQGGVTTLDGLDDTLALAVTRWRKESRSVPKAAEDKLAELEAFTDVIEDVTGWGGEKNHGYELFQRSMTALEKWIDDVRIPKDNVSYIVPADW